MGKDAKSNKALEKQWEMAQVPGLLSRTGQAGPEFLAPGFGPGWVTVARQGVNQ